MSRDSLCDLALMSVEGTKQKAWLHSNHRRIFFDKGAETVVLIGMLCYLQKNLMYWCFDGIVSFEHKSYIHV